MAQLAPTEDVFGVVASDKPAQQDTDWSHVIQLAWDHLSRQQDNLHEDLLPVSRFLDLVDVLEEMLSLPSGSILAPSAREIAQQFMERDIQLEISRKDFETLLNNLSGDQMKSSLPGIHRVNEAYTQIMAEPDVSTLFAANKPPHPVENLADDNESTDNDEYDFQPVNPSNPLHTSTPLHPKFSNSNDLNQPRLFKRPTKKFNRDRRAVSLGVYSNPKLDDENHKPLSSGDENLDHPWKVPVSPKIKHRRSHKDIRLLKAQEEQLLYLEQNASLLDDQRLELQSKLLTCQQQLKELQENDSRRLQHIEEIEHELELTQNELHERRMKQNDELRKAREAAAALEAKVTRGDDTERRLTEDIDTVDKAISPPNLGSPLMSSTPAPKPLEDWSDVSVRLEKLEDEKKAYQNVLDSMETERAGYLAVISELKEQLGNLQSEIASLKASTDEHHQQLQQVTEDQNLHDDSMTLMMDLAPDSIFQKIIPMIAEQRTYIKELLEGTSSSESDSKAEKQSSFFSSKGVTVIAGTVGLCLLGALVAEVLGSGSAPSSDILWWQQYGSTIESWGATLDSWVRPNNQHIPS